MQTFDGDDDGKTKLLNAEKSNIVGKTNDDSDIIPLNKLYPPRKPIDVNNDSNTKPDIRPRWQPINMAYGMNVSR